MLTHCEVSFHPKWLLHSVLTQGTYVFSFLWENIKEYNSELISLLDFLQ